MEMSESADMLSRVVTLFGASLLVVWLPALAYACGAFRRHPLVSVLIGTSFLFFMVSFGCLRWSDQVLSSGVLWIVISFIVAGHGTLLCAAFVNRPQVMNVVETVPHPDEGRAVVREIEHTQFDVDSGDSTRPTQPR